MPQVASVTVPPADVRIKERRIDKFLIALFTRVFVTSPSVPDHVDTQHHDGRIGFVTQRTFMRLQLVVDFAMMGTKFATVGEPFVALSTLEGALERVASTHVTSQMNLAHECGFALLQPTNKITKFQKLKCDRCLLHM